MSRTVTVHLTLGAFRPAWCDRCLTSAAFDVGVYAFTGGSGPHPLGELTVCGTCDNPAEAVASAVERIRRAVDDARRP